MAQPTDPATDPAADGTILEALLAALRALKRLSGTGPVDGPALGVLAEIDRHAPVRLGDVASACGLDASTISRHVAALERDGYVARESDPSDRRASRLVLTPSGQHELTTAMQRRRDVVDRALAGWRATDRDRLRRLLERFADDMAAASAPAAPAPPPTAAPLLPARSDGGTRLDRTSR